MHDQECYRSNAADCLSEAHDVCPPGHRNLNLFTAAAWLSLARQDEAIENVIAGWNTPKVPEPRMPSFIFQGFLGCFRRPFLALQVLPALRDRSQLGFGERSYQGESAHRDHSANLFMMFAPLEGWRATRTDEKLPAARIVRRTRQVSRRVRSTRASERPERLDRDRRCACPSSPHRLGSIPYWCRGRSSELPSVRVLDARTARQVAPGEELIEDALARELITRLLRR
jgi:hypothetical protein